MKPRVRTRRSCMMRISTCHLEASSNIEPAGRSLSWPGPGYFPFRTRGPCGWQASKAAFLRRTEPESHGAANSVNLPDGIHSRRGRRTGPASRGGKFGKPDRWKPFKRRGAVEACVMRGGKGAGGWVDPGHGGAEAGIRQNVIQRALTAERYSVEMNGGKSKRGQPELMGGTIAVLGWEALAKRSPRSAGVDAPRGGRGRSLRVAAALAATLGAVFFVVPVATSRPARAVGGAVIAVTPTRIPLEAAQGERRSVTVELINQGDAEVDLIPEVSLVRGEGSGDISLTSDEKCSWITPGRETIRLAPAARELFPFAVEVPEGAETGPQRFAVCFKPSGGGGEGVGFTGGVAVLIELEALPAGGGGRGGANGLIAGAAAASLLALGAVFFLVARRRARGKADAESGEGRA